MTAAAEIRPARLETWEIVENGEVRAAYPAQAIRLSIVWKADLETWPTVEPLTLDRVMNIFATDFVGETSSSGFRPIHFLTGMDDFIGEHLRPCFRDFQAMKQGSPQQFLG